MKVFRCKDVSPMYCPFEMHADTTEEIIEQVRVHGKAAHGLTDETIHPTMVSLWKSKIHEEPDAGKT